MKTVLICFFLFAPLNQGQASPSEYYQRIIAWPAKAIDEINEATLREQDLPKGFNLLAELSKHYSKFKNATEFESKSTEQCMNDISSTMKLPWMKAYNDASAKRPSGVLNGNIKWYGDFDECLNIPAMKPLFEDRFFGPKFCRTTAVRVNSTTPFAAIVALCLPDTCNETDISVIGNTILPEAVGYKFLESKTYCQRTDLGLDHLDPYSYIAVTILSCIAFFMVAGLAVDIYLRFQPKKETEGTSATFSKKEMACLLGRFGTLLLYFSPWTNLEKLLAIPPASDRIPNLTALNGMRALSLAYVMLGHTYFLQFIENPVSLVKSQRLFTFQFFFAGFFAVDTFFFLSGFLAYWSLFRKLTMKNINVVVRFVMAYVYRYIRISVPHFALILISLGLFPLLSNGPFYIQQLDEACAKNWWVNMIYLGNFIEPENPCVGWTWYLMVDMQVFLVIPFLVYFFVHWPVVGWLCSTALLLGDIISSIAITVVENLPATLIQPVDYENMLIEFGETRRNYDDYFLVLYIKTYSRMGPYIIGVMFCHLLVKHQKSVKRILFSKYWVQAIGWILTFVILLSIVYARADINAGLRLEDHTTEAIYAGFARNSWALALGWITLACSLNKGGIVGQILQWNLWAVPARLSYSGYLVHILVMMFYVYTTRRPYYFTDITTAYYYCSTYVIVLMVSTLYSLAFESPVIGLLKAL